MGGSHWHILGKHFITVIDAAKMFYQWRVKPENRNRSVVIPHSGQEVFNVATMG